MLQRVLAVGLSLTVLCGNPILLAAGAAGQIKGVAMLQSGEHLAGQEARLRSLDLGEVAATTTTTGSGEFSFAGVSAGSYIVELVSNGAVVGASAPVTLTSRAMTVDAITITAAAAPAAALNPLGPLGGSFWTSTFGMITAAALAAGVTTAIVVTQDDASASK